MILYFTGTGNSAYVAKRLAKGINDEAMDLFIKLKTHDYTTMHSDKPWVIVAPTYAWRIPRILHAWLQKTCLEGSKTLYFVMTCGGNIGDAGKYLVKLCNQKQMKYAGCASIIMPENYIAMFSTPSQEEARSIIQAAQKPIDATIRSIKHAEMIAHSPITLKDKLNSSIVNDMFYPMFVHAKKFHVSDSCISCEKCVNVCPLENIQMKNGKPLWGKDCTHCMACICRCPSEAIEYGEHSKGQPRYSCPNV